MPDRQAERALRWRASSRRVSKLTRVAALVLVSMTVLATPSASAQAPEITIFGPSAEPPIRETQPLLHGTSTDILDPVTLQIFEGATASGTPIQTAVELGPMEDGWTLAPATELADGTYTAVATQIDLDLEVGTSEAVTFTIDTRPPAVGLVTPANGTRLSNANPSFGGAAGSAPGDAQSVTLAIYAGTSPTGTPIAGLSVARNGATWSTPSPGPQLPDGTYTAQATQDDTAGNIGTSLASTFIVDTHAPAVSLNALATPTSDATPSFGGNAGTEPEDKPKVTVKLYAGSTPSGTPVAHSSATQHGGTWSTAPTSHLPDGTYTAQAEQSDDTGNTGLSAPSTFTVDTRPPLITLTLPADGASTSTGSLAVAGTAGTAVGDSDVVTLELFAGSVLVAGETPLESIQVLASGGQWSAAVGGLGDGAYILRAEQSDAAGNRGLSFSHSFTVALAAPSAPATPVAPVPVAVAPAASVSVPPANANQPRLMQPFPIVRIAGSYDARGATVKLLSVQAPAGARVKITCKGAHCPIKALTRIARTSRTGSSQVSFPGFTRVFPPGVVLEVRVSRNGEIGKYTRFAVRHGKLPVRTDTCLDTAGLHPRACPTT